MKFFIFSKTKVFNFSKNSFSFFPKRFAELLSVNPFTQKRPEKFGNILLTIVFS